MSSKNYATQKSRDSVFSSSSNENEDNIKIEKMIKEVEGFKTTENIDKIEYMDLNQLLVLFCECQADQIPNSFLRNIIIQQQYLMESNQIIMTCQKLFNYYLNKKHSR